MAKLTLSVDARVVLRAKEYAKRQGPSVSQLVESYLSGMVDPAPTTKATPILRSLRGILKNADIGEYRKRLAVRHR